MTTMKLPEKLHPTLYTTSNDNVPFQSSAPSPALTVYHFHSSLLHVHAGHELSLQYIIYHNMHHLKPSFT